MAWLDSGEGPYCEGSVREDLLKWNEGIPHPRGTWRYNYELERAKEMESTYTFKFGRWEVKVQLHNFNIEWRRYHKVEQHRVVESGNLRAVYYTARRKIRRVWHTLQGRRAGDMSGGLL